MSDFALFKKLHKPGEYVEGDQKKQLEEMSKRSIIILKENLTDKFKNAIDSGEFYSTVQKTIKENEEKKKEQREQKKFEKQLSLSRASRQSTLNVQALKKSATLTRKKANHTGR